MSAEQTAPSRSEWVIKSAIRAFRNHELIEGDENSRRWRIAKKYDDGSIMGTYATEVISLWGGRIYAGGDIDDCVFAYYSGTKDDDPGQNNHKDKLCWIGRCTDVLYYVAQKAMIGLTDNGKLTETWVSDVAKTELRRILKEEGVGYGEDEREAIEDAIPLCDDSEEQVWVHLYQNLSDPYDIPADLGKVVSARVIFAWAACRRVCQLLWGPADDEDRYAKYEQDDEEKEAEEEDTQ